MGYVHIYKFNFTAFIFSGNEFTWSNIYPQFHKCLHLDACGIEPRHLDGQQYGVIMYFKEMYTKVLRLKTVNVIKQFPLILLHR